MSSRCTVSIGRSIMIGWSFGSVGPPAFGLQLPVVHVDPTACLGVCVAFHKAPTTAGSEN